MTDSVIINIVHWQPNFCLLLLRLFINSNYHHHHHHKKNLPQPSQNCILIGLKDVECEEPKFTLELLGFQESPLFVGCLSCMVSLCAFVFSSENEDDTRTSEYTQVLQGLNRILVSVLELCLAHSKDLIDAVVLQSFVFCWLITMNY